MRRRGGGSAAAGREEGDAAVEHCHSLRRRGGEGGVMVTAGRRRRGWSGTTGPICCGRSRDRRLGEERAVEQRKMPATEQSTGRRWDLRRLATGIKLLWLRRE
jgi:hypothetical protein